MKYPINIMQIVLSLECGGLEKIVINLAKRLNNGRFRTIICCLDRIGNLISELKNEKIKVVMVKRRQGVDFFLPLRLAYILRKEKINLVHTHNLGPLFYGTLAAKLAGVPVIVNTRHGRAKKHRSSYIWNMNDAIVAISEDAKKEMLKWNRIDIKKTKVIYNGIDIDKYSNQQNGNEVKKALNINNSTYVIGTVARLSPEKDQFTLIDAFLKVVNKIDDVKLIFVGEGGLKEELVNYVKKLGIFDKIIFLGFRDDVFEILPAFDVFVLSSLTEGIALTLLEAMAVSKPIVSTNVGGNPEVIVDGKTGFLVPPKNPEKMSEAIITLLKNRELGRKMGETGYIRVKEKFSLDRMANEYESLYDYWLKKKGAV